MANPFSRLRGPFTRLRNRPAEVTSASSVWGTPNTAGVSIPSELAFYGVDFSIGEKAIVRDVSLVAPSGTVTCLLGPSGSGKTTLLRLAAGMERPGSGKISVDGRSIAGEGMMVPPEKRGMGLVFQDYALFPHLTNGENVGFGLAHLPRKARAAQVAQMLERVGLGDRAQHYPHHLSGGEQQRVALARALAPRPGIVLMDEPFSGLDSRLRDTMRSETLAILRETRATAIVVTHDAEEALRMGDQIALLEGGRLQQAGTARDLFFRPNNMFAASFFSELNVFDAMVEAGRVLTPLGPVRVNGLKTGAPVQAAFRTGSIAVSTETSREAQASGRILSHRFVGEHDLLTIGVRGHEEPVRVRVAADSLPSGALSGAQEVFLTPSLAGSFAFAKP